MFPMFLSSWAVSVRGRLEEGSMGSWFLHVFVGLFMASSVSSVVVISYFCVCKG